MKTLLLLSSLSLFAFSANASCKGGVKALTTAIEFTSPIPNAFAREFVDSERNHMRFEVTSVAGSPEKTDVYFSFFGQGRVPKLIKDDYSGKLVPTAFYDVKVADLSLKCANGICQGGGIAIDLRKSTLSVISAQNVISEATNGFSPDNAVRGWKSNILLCP